MKNLFYFLLMSGLILSVYSCDPDEPEEGAGEEEVITTLNLTLTATNGDVVTMRFEDLDGDGGDEPTVTGGTLSANTNYAGSLELLNEAKDPVEDITEEVIEEDEVHQFFFSTTVPDIEVRYADEDANGNPLGQVIEVRTGDAGSGTFTVTLRHEPDKFADGVMSGDISNAFGETDIEAEFNVTVQ